MALLSRLDEVDKVLFTLGPTCSGTAEPLKVRASASDKAVLPIRAP